MRLVHTQRKQRSDFLAKSTSWIPLFSMISSAAGCRVELPPAPAVARQVDAATAELVTSTICGAPASETPIAQPLYSCRDGSVIAGPMRVLRTAAGVENVLEFPLQGEQDDSCITVVTGEPGDTHRSSSGSVSIDDALLFGPNALNENLTTLEFPIYLSPGTHRVRAVTRSAPDTFLEITVRTGGSATTKGRTFSDYQDLFNLHATPALLSTAMPTARFTADGSVLRFNGLPAAGKSFRVDYGFQLRDAISCQATHDLRGSASIHTPSTYRLDLAWDGRLADGFPAPDGIYGYNAVAKFIETSASGDRVVDVLSSGQNTIRVDRTAILISVKRPTDGGYLGSRTAELEVEWQDPEVNGYASGVNPV